MNSFKCFILICVTSSEVGVQLGKFICTGIKELHFHDIGINSSGFVEAQEQITGGVKLVFINIRSTDTHDIF